MLVFWGNIIKSQCTGLQVFVTNSPVSCLTSLTTGTVSVWNGTPPYTYTWLPSGGNGSVAINLSPNSYTVLAKDATGCTGSGQLIIYSNTGINLMFSTINNLCYGESNGQINVTAQNATSPINYAWNPPAPNSSSITGLPAGIYQLTATDALGCTSTGTTVITQPTDIITSVAIKTLSCNGALSSATAQVNGGTSPYTYSWSPVTGTNSVLPNIPAGNYSVTITDGNSCKKTVSVSITQPPAMQNTLTLTNATCNSFTNGSASSNITGGNPAYSYTWSPINVNASSVSGLGAGNYTLFVKDSKSCTYTETFVISQPAAITQTITHTDEFCINADGTATVNVNGGTAPYTFTWSTMPVQTNSVATGLAAGNYTVQIKDSKNCTSQAVVTIGNISNMLATVTNKNDVSCFGGCNGSATSAISGGSGPYTYNWLGVPSATNQSVNNLCQGTYTVKITDALGCYATTTVNISEPTQLSYSIGGVATICSGSNTALSASVNGGTPGYTYNWQPGSLTGVTVVVSPTVSTGYSLTVTDSKGCTGAVKVYSVFVNPPLTLSSGSGNINVCPNVPTSITVNANGGDGNYNYTWMPGNVHNYSISVNVNSTTIFTVTITDGCGSTPLTNTVSVNVLAVANPNFTVTSRTGCQPFCTQFSNLTTGTTTALWSFGDFSPPVQGPVTTHCYNKSGVYNVMLTVTNSSGCKSSVVKQKYITVYGKPLADYLQEPEKINLNENTANFTNSSLNATSFEWSLDGLHLSNSQNLQHSFLDAGCFNLQLIAKNENACADTTVREICVTEGFNFWAPNAFSPNNDEINDRFKPEGTGWMEGTYNLEILSRWGVTVFKTSDPTESWDGKIGGTKATDDIYVWKVFVKDIYDDEHNLTGHVLIMR